MARLTRPQAEFLRMPHKFRAYVAGFGSGKTWVGCTAIAQHFWEHPRIHAGYFAPSFPMIRDIFYPTMDEVAHTMGMRIKVYQGNKEVSVFSGAQYRGTVLCRSMDDPGSIVGFKIGHAMVDELDTMKKEKARDAWRKIIARMRFKGAELRNGIDVTTTPEGFKFVYEQFVKAVSRNPELGKLYGLIQASTFENEIFLPDGYIQSLLDSYPLQLIRAYLNGQFTNLAIGAVYPDFDRFKNHTDEVIEPNEPLHVGMDFNVNNCTAAIGVIRDKKPRILAELTGVRDTPAMVKSLREKFPQNHISVYPDASGQSNKTVNASLSDLQILKDAKFAVWVNGTNPLVKDRVMSMNASICNAREERTLLINTRECPTVTEHLEQQVYDKNGEPDKKSGNDHAPDALGYFVTYRWPVVRPTVTRQIQVHHMSR
jgi:hypothetical protein